MEHALTRGHVLMASALVTLAIFAGGLGGDFVWDDHSLLQQQAAAPDALARVWTEPFFWERAPNVADYYRPLVSLALALQWRVFGASPFGYHLVNLLLHVACTLLACVWLERRLAVDDADATRADSGAAHMLLPAALLGSLLFAAHPSRAQVVSWISGSTDLWSGLFALGAAVLLQRGQALGTSVCAALCGGIAIAAKETAIVLPVALALDAWLRPHTRGHQVWRTLGLMLALGAGFFALRGRVVSTPMSALWDSGLYSLKLRALFTLGWDVAATFAPHNPRMQLNFDLAVLERLDPALLGFMWLGAGALLGFIALLIVVRTRPTLRGYAADLALFFVLLAPSLNLVPIGRGTTCSERFLYLPLLGLTAMFARALLQAAGRLRVALMALGLTAIASCSLISVRETGYFADDRTLQEHFYRQDPTELLTIRKLIKIYARANEVGRARFMNGRLLRVLDHVTTPPVTDLTRAANLISYAVTDAQLVADDNPARLIELRSFLDAASQPGGKASLKVDGTLHVVAITPAVHAQLAKLEGGTLWLEEARIMAHARSLDLDAAESAARALREQQPASARAQALGARLAAFRGRFAEALALWPMNDPQLGRDGFVPAVQRARAEVDAARTHGPIPAQIAEAVAVASLGLPARGRQLLAQILAQVALKPPLVEAQIRVELAGRRPQRALALLREAERRDPANAGQYRAWQQGLSGNR